MKNVEYYEDLQIPARLFFEVIETSDLNLLVIKFKHKEEKLKEAWEKIYDLYYEKRNDSKMSHVLEVQKKMRLTQYKIDIIKDALRVLITLNLPKETAQTICEALMKLGVKIDNSKPINEEVLNKLQIDVNNLRIQLESQAEHLKTLTSGVKSSYEDACVSIENTLERTISEDVSLSKFISLENSAKERSKIIQSKRNK